MAESATIKIDGNALQSEIAKKGVTLAYASTELGYTKNYFSNCIARNQIARPAAIALENVFKIPLEAYRMKMDPVAEPAPSYTREMKFGIDYGLLGDIIRKNVYEAVYQAWKDQ